MRLIGAAVVIVLSAAILIPLVTRLVEVLKVPVLVGVGLYLIVRLVNAWLDRW